MSESAPVSEQSDEQPGENPTEPPAFDPDPDSETMRRLRAGARWVNAQAEANLAMREGPR